MMTENKPIIINGVNVRECKHYDDLDCYAEGDYPLDCKYSPNCYFKQLSRKTQECEELKAEVKKQKEIAKEYERRWLSSYGV